MHCHAGRIAGLCWPPGILSPMDDLDRAAPSAFYDAYGEREWERLDRDFFHRLEWESTVEQLEAHLPAADGEGGTRRVLDVGGGPGRYSRWLAERGFEVALVEPSGTQRALARRQLRDRGVADRVAVQAGDVRRLGLADDAVSATCCLGGPLSHVLDAAERDRAARELRRVTKPGGPVFVSVMGLLGLVLIAVQSAGRSDGWEDLAILPDLVADQAYSAALLERDGGAPRMAETHFFRRAELVDLLDGAGLTVESVRALEGVAAGRRTEFDALDAAARDVVRRVNDQLRDDPTLADVSPHMLAVCRA